MGKLAPLVAIVGLAAMGLLLGGCESQRRYQMDYDPSALRVALRAETGTVEAIEVTLYGEPSPVNVSAIVGWGASGKTDDNVPALDQLRVRVRLDSGVEVAANDVDEGEFHVGDRVRVINNRVFPA